jgi:hypothetical protein
VPGRPPLFLDACLRGLEAFEELAREDDCFRYPIYYLKPKA